MKVQSGARVADEVLDELRNFVAYNNTHGGDRVTLDSATEEAIRLYLARQRAVWSLQRFPRRQRALKSLRRKSAVRAVASGGRDAEGKDPE